MPKSDYELLDINELVTNGQSGFIAYRVTGNSMIEYIKFGYIVFVNPNCEPKRGDIVVCGQNGLNHINLFEGRIYLLSINKSKKDFQIQGVVIGHLAVYK